MEFLFAETTRLSLIVRKHVNGSLLPANISSRSSPRTPTAPSESPSQYRSPSSGLKNPPLVAQKLVLSLQIPV